MRRLAVIFTLLACAPAAQAAVPTTKFAFAGGCYRVGDAGPLRFQAANLGQYLLLEADGTYRTASGSVAEPDQTAVWTAEDERSLTNGGARLEGAVSEATGCPAIPEVALNARGKPIRGARPWSTARGFHDQHAHLMAFDFLGGNFHCGRPWSPFGVEAALPDCASIQGPQGSAAPVQNFLDFGAPVAPHDTVGWPTFVDWPGYDKLSYEGTYWRWLQRAWMGGLRLIQSNHVDNEVLCSLIPNRQTSCNDMDAARRQTEYLYQLQDYVDAQYGGPGKGFLRIVTDPYQARRVINQGKLAVVMGIEVSRIFGCGVSSETPECSKEDIDRGLDEIEQLGVRVFYPIHKFDNAFGGTKMDGGPVGALINAANRKQTGAFWNVKTCNGPEGDEDREQIAPGGGVAELLTTGGLGLATPGTFPAYPAAPHCNQKGLTDLGEYVLREMIDRGFMIEIDHMSSLASRQSLAIIEAEKYPGVMSSHTWASESDYPRVRAIGGAVAPYAGSSESYAAKWKADRTVNRSKKFPYGIGYGADTNGLGAQGPPREGAASNPVTYPFRLGGVRFDKQVSGEQEYDINTDGVAHYGLYPDWIADLRQIAGPKIVKDLFNGAEGYLGMWERASGIRGPTCPTGRISHLGVGPIRIGASWTRVLRRAGQPWTRPGSSYRWCRPDQRKRRAVGAYFERGRVALVGIRSRTAIPRRLREDAQRRLIVGRDSRGGRYLLRNRTYAVTTSKIASSKKRALRALKQAGL